MKLTRISGVRVVKTLKRARFVEIRMRGSHCYLYHKQKDRLVTVPSSCRKNYRFEDFEINFKTS
jgi:predicted RNA binding protein YcfA (HicA-like mRNA interferase family)